jgi:hypothetical protein
MLFHPVISTICKLQSAGVALRHEFRVVRRGLEAIQLTWICVPRVGVTALYLLNHSLLRMNFDLFVIYLMAPLVTQTI